MPGRLSLRLRKEWHFDPSQPRDNHGEWTAGGIVRDIRHGIQGDYLAHPNHPEQTMRYQVAQAKDGTYRVRDSRYSKLSQPQGLPQSASRDEALQHADELNHKDMFPRYSLFNRGDGTIEIREKRGQYGEEKAVAAGSDANALAEQMRDLAEATGGAVVSGGGSFHAATTRGTGQLAKSALTLRKRGYPQLVRAHVRGAGIPPEVQAEIAHYLTKRPDIRACEAAEHGYDPMQDIPRYLAQELAEPEHASVRSGPLTMDSIRQWEEQEDAEHADDGHVAKEQPAASDVHVNTATDIVKPKKKRKKGDEVDANLSVLKADDEQRVVYGIVLEPDVEDSQGDVVSKADVEQAAHRFLYDGAKIGDQHKRLAPDTVRPVENYIAPVDFEMGGEIVKAGSWVLAVHVPDDGLWEQVRKGDKGAFSVAGTGVRSPL